MLPSQLSKGIVLRQAHCNERVKVLERLVQAGPTGKGLGITGIFGFGGGVIGIQGGSGGFGIIGKLMTGIIGVGGLTVGGATT